MGAITIALFIMISRYKYNSSKMILNKLGIEYHENKKPKYFLGWDDIRDIEISGFGPGSIIIFFYGKTSKEKMKGDHRLKRITEDFLYLYLDFEDIDFIHANYTGVVHMNSYFKKLYSKHQRRSKN